MIKKEITYRKKLYFNYDKNTKTVYYAIRNSNNIILMSKTKYLTTKESISSIYHNFNNKIEYSRNLKKVLDNENYIVTKHEYNRLFKESKDSFKKNCFL